MRSHVLEHYFPNLTTNNYDLTSPSDPTYNCIAWAMGDTSRWWEKFPVDGYYWPADIATNETTVSWLSLFALAGYVTCENGELEEGLEKIAIYATEEGEPQHIARQLVSGSWTSKLGGLQDITHQSLEAIETTTYGAARYFMKRPQQRPRET